MKILQYKFLPAVGTLGPRVRIFDPEVPYKRLPYLSSRIIPVEDDIKSSITNYLIDCDIDIVEFADPGFIIIQGWYLK